MKITPQYQPIIAQTQPLTFQLLEGVHLEHDHVHSRTRTTQRRTRQDHPLL